jgi:hypothetical protein
LERIEQVLQSMELERAGQITVDHGRPLLPLVGDATSQRPATAILGRSSAALATAVAVQGGQQDVPDPRAFLSVG